MHFELTQQIDGPPGAVAAAFTDPEFYALLAHTPKLGAPEVLAREVDGDVVRMQVRHRFTGELSAAARAAIDPKKLTWVEHATHDLAARTVQFKLVADHYRDRFKCQGGYRFADHGGATRLVASGDLSVRAPLVGSVVEKAIISGLREHLEVERDLIEQFLGTRSDQGG